jgi:excisionase family DNA binding protein
VTAWSFERAITAEEAAVKLGTSVRTVARMADDGRLVTRLSPRGRGRLFSVDQVEMIVAARYGRDRSRAAARAYQRALQGLRDAHPEQFRTLYAAERAREGLKTEASPVSAGDAG